MWRVSKNSKSDFSAFLHVSKSPQDNFNIHLILSYMNNGNPPILTLTVFSQRFERRIKGVNL